MQEIKVGDRVQWVNRSNGRRHEGIVLELYDAVARVQTGNGRRWGEISRMKPVRPALVPGSERYQEAVKRRNRLVCMSYIVGCTSRDWQEIERLSRDINAAHGFETNSYLSLAGAIE